MLSGASLWCLDQHSSGLAGLGRAAKMPGAGLDQALRGGFGLADGLINGLLPQRGECQERRSGRAGDNFVFMFHIYFLFGFA